METEFSTNGLSKETTAIRLRLQTTQATWAAGLEQLELQRSTEANYLQGKVSFLDNPDQTHFYSDNETQILPILFSLVFLVRY